MLIFTYLSRGISTKFCIAVEVVNVITVTNFLAVKGRRFCGERAENGGFP